MLIAGVAVLLPAPASGVPERNRTTTKTRADDRPDPKRRGHEKSRGHGHENHEDDQA